MSNFHSKHLEKKKNETLIKLSRDPPEIGIKLLYKFGGNLNKHLNALSRDPVIGFR